MITIRLQDLTLKQISQIHQYYKKRFEQCCGECPLMNVYLECYAVHLNWDKDIDEEANIGTHRYIDIPDDLWIELQHQEPMGYKVKDYTDEKEKI